MGFIWPNDTGKTADIKYITGILDFYKDQINICQKSMKEDSVLCKSLIAYIPNNPDLYEYITKIWYLNSISDIFDISPEKKTNIILKIFLYKAKYWLITHQFSF